MPKHPKQAIELAHKIPVLKQLSSEVRQLDLLLKKVQQHLPTPLNQHCVAVARGQNSLILYTDSSAWASRLRFFSRQLVVKLSADSSSVSKISVRVLPAQGHQKVEETPAKRRLSRENAALIRQVAESMEACPLKSALDRLSRHEVSTE